MCNTDDIIIVNHVESVGSMGNYIIYMGTRSSCQPSGYRFKYWRNVLDLAKSNKLNNIRSYKSNNSRSLIK